MNPQASKDPEKTNYEIGSDCLRCWTTQNRREILNLDGVSIQGAKTIYASRGQAGEYAPLATNPYRGGHGCAYCYVPRVTKQDRKEFDAGAVLRPTFFTLLRRDAKLYQLAKVREQGMPPLSFWRHGPDA